MSGDGAHLGVSPTRALGTILGGDSQPTDADRRNPDEMRVWILSASGPPFAVDANGAATDKSYDDACRWTARQILEAFLTDPTLAQQPTEAVYDWPTIKADPRYETDPVAVMREHQQHPGLMRLLQQRGVELEPGLSGFMWGWAVNAARYCVELGPTDNPAILDIG